jgi:pimeloyl-ACP methyl ester carboxylesterase
MKSERLTARDGAALHVLTIGEGRPLLLIHGFVSSARVNWFDYGTAALLSEGGFSVIAPDLRGHGNSASDTAYPPDILRQDMADVLDHFGITDFDCCGYSLGARTAVRLALMGRRPARLVIAGMGLSGLINSLDRRDWFLEAIANRAAPRSAAEARVAQFMRTMGMDGAVAGHVLMSQVESSLEDLHSLACPSLVLSGRDDDDNGSAAELAQALPDARLALIPGNHMSAITSPAFGRSILAFLTERR